MMLPTFISQMLQLKNDVSQSQAQNMVFSTY